MPDFERPGSSALVDLNIRISALDRRTSCPNDAAIWLISAWLCSIESSALSSKHCLQHRLSMLNGSRQVHPITMSKSTRRLFRAARSHRTAGRYQMTNRAVDIFFDHKVSQSLRSSQRSGHVRINEALCPSSPALCQHHAHTLRKKQQGRAYGDFYDTFDYANARIPSRASDLTQGVLSLARRYESNAWNCACRARAGIQRAELFVCRTFSEAGLDQAPATSEAVKAGTPTQYRGQRTTIEGTSDADIQHWTR